MRKSAFLAGTVAIVVGGGRGIGAATASAFARAGAAVTVAARTEEEIRDVANRIEAKKGMAIAVPTNIGDSKQVKRMVERTLNAFGRIDFLINCAAMIQPMGRPAWEADPDVWRRAVEINLVGLFFLSRAVVPRMLEQRRGRLLHVSSNLSELPVARASAYCAARAGANHFIRVLAAELSGTGITANTVYPGIVDTPGLREFRSALFGGKQTQFRLPQARLNPQDPLESARLLLWLCSSFTGWMSGQTVDIDDPLVRYGMARFFRSAIR